MASTYTTNNIAFPNNYTGSGITLNTGAGGGLTGTAGSYIVSTGAVTGSTTSWVNPNTNFNDGTNTIMSIPYGSNTVEIAEAATLDVKGNVVINGQDLEERLSTIETLLQIPTRDVTMEAKHPKLAELYKQYMHELEKYKTWDRIKGEEDGTT
jgi:hypothetical protein